MKKLFLLTFTLIMLGLNAQNPWGVAFKLNNYNFYKPNDNSTNSTNWYDIQGAEIGFQKQITNWLDIYVPVRIGSTDVFNTKTDLRTSTSLLGLDVTGQLKYFKPTQIFNPYLFAGIGAQNTRGKTDIGIPAGAGLNVLLGEGLHLNLQYGLRTSLTDFRSNYQAAAGLLFGFGGSRGGNDMEAAPVMTTAMPVKKPMVNTEELEAKWAAECDAKMSAMSAEYDAKLAGMKAECDARVSAEAARLKAEYDAKMATMSTQVTTTTAPKSSEVMVSEVVVLNETKATKETKRVLDDAMEGVQFESNSSKLMTASFAKLNNVVRIMKSNSMNIAVNGHTDSQGVEATNQALSAARAKACMDYIISKGISASRLKSAGFGSASPRDTNKTPAGRFRNRRVEFSPF
jgi:outer membrane protein OmpA-like peptidoglycan-associated protein